jgi:hypothetical protein
LAVGVIVFLLFCGTTVARDIAASLRPATDGTSISVDPQFRLATPRSVVPSPSLSAPLTTVDGGPSTSFHLPLGTAARFSDQDGTWTVAVLGVAWIDDCEDVFGSTLSVLAVDIRYEVIDGAVSIIPLNDFAFVLADGTKARVGMLSACAAPPLDYTVISAGDISRGFVTIELPSGTQGVHGELTYGQLVKPTASWNVQR